MRIRDQLYFAPGITFAEVDTVGPALAQQVGQRIQGFYLAPAVELAEAGHAFAAGVMAVTAIDALARLRTGREDVGGRFQAWCAAYLPSCAGGRCKRFYESFRNGLVHEGRIKDGCEFSLESHVSFRENNGTLVCNPRLLLAEVEAALRAYVRTLEADPQDLAQLRHRILIDFTYEFSN